MDRIRRAKLAMAGLLVVALVACRRVKAETVERALMVPPATYAGATLFDVPVTSLTQWVMLLYGLSLFAWHIKTKWFGKRSEVDG
ncbi:hypothetical protein [Pseudomonas shirazica]|uniref:hypothetical protein n=1 Tax=Pseudomonas shirazica TaxID=1940636 RepID=UPI003AAB5109